jgi:hypothetical protein
MAVTPKGSWLHTLLHSVYNQSASDSVAAQRIIHALPDKLLKVADPS